jgi:hypothetical protein
MSKEIKYDRRQFLGTAAMTVAAAQLGMIGSGNAQSSKTNSPGAAPAATDSTIDQGATNSNTSFAALKQIDAGLLHVSYAEAGPASGAAVILLHGWPYDVHSFVDVAPRLASAGYRVIVPHLRGYGATRFLSNETFEMASRRCWPSILSLCWTP